MGSTGGYKSSKQLSSTSASSRKKPAHVIIEKRLEINAGRAFRTFIAAIRRLQQAFRSWRDRRTALNQRRMNRRKWQHRDDFLVENHALLVLSDKLGFTDDKTRRYIETHSLYDVNFMSFPPSTFGKALRKEHRSRKKHRWIEGEANSDWHSSFRPQNEYRGGGQLSPPSSPLRGMMHKLDKQDGGIDSLPSSRGQFAFRSLTSSSSGNDEGATTELDTFVMKLSGTGVGLKDVICMGRLHSAKETHFPVYARSTFPFCGITPKWCSRFTNYTCNMLKWFFIDRWTSNHSQWAPTSVLVATSDVDIIKVTDRGIYKNEEARVSGCTHADAEWVTVCTMAEILGVRERLSNTTNEFFFELQLTGGRTMLFCYEPWGGRAREDPEPVDDFNVHGPLLTRVTQREEVTATGGTVVTRKIEHSFSNAYMDLIEHHEEYTGKDLLTHVRAKEPRPACETEAVHRIGLAWVAAFQYAIDSTKREEAPLIDLRSRIADQLFEKADDSQASFDSVAENSSFFTRTDADAVFPSQASMILQYYRMKQADLKTLEGSLKENAHQHQLFKDPRIQFSMKSEYEGGPCLCPCRSSECAAVELSCNCDAGTCETWACDDPCPCNPRCVGTFSSLGCDSCFDMRKCGICSCFQKCGPARRASSIGFVANLLMAIVVFFSMMQMSGYVNYVFLPSLRITYVVLLK
jgi:hypothetical protein